MSDDSNTMDVVKVGAGYFYDFNLDGEVQAEEVFTIQDAEGETEEEKIINKIYEIDSFNSCMPIPEQLEAPNLMIFNSIDEYFNDNISNIDISVKEVKELRFLIKKNLDITIKKLTAELKGKELDYNHPYVRLLSTLLDIKKLFHTVRIVLTSEEKFGAIYNKDHRIIFINIPNSKAREFYNIDKLTEQRLLENLSKGLLPTIAHEFTHLLNREKIWDANIHTILPDDTLCTEKALFSDKSTPPIFDVSLDISIMRRGRKFRYNDYADNYDLFPILLNSAKLCIPEEYKESDLADEISAYQITATLIFFMAELSVDEMSALMKEGEKAQEIRELIYYKLKDYSLVPLYYLGIGPDVFGIPRLDLHDFLTTDDLYKHPEDPPDCFDPILPEIED